MPCRVRFLPSEKEFEVEAGEMTLLEATRAVGLPIASACGENGACARCGLEIVAGAEAIDTATKNTEGHPKQATQPQSKTGQTHTSEIHYLSLCLLLCTPIKWGRPYCVVGFLKSVEIFEI